MSMTFKRTGGEWACSPKTATVWSHTIHGIALVADCQQTWAPVEAQRANAALCAAAPDLLKALAAIVEAYQAPYSDPLIADALEAIGKAVQGHGYTPGDI
jgi:hypothetical protein